MLASTICSTSDVTWCQQSIIEISGKVRLDVGQKQWHEKRPIKYVQPGEVARTHSSSGNPEPRIYVWDFAGTDSPTNAARKAALLALGNIGTEAKGALPFVLAVFLDPDDEISKTARKTIGAIKPR